MRGHKRTILLFFVMLAIVIVAAMATLRGQSQQGSVSMKQEKDDESFGPIVDYIEPVPAEKLAASNRYNERHLKEDRRVTEMVMSADWMSKLPAFPAALSDVVVLGEVTDKKAYMSSDKTGAYSEFTIRINEILKNDSQSPLAANSNVTAEREGARIRYPSGYILRYRLSNQTMPRVGRRYVFFLQRSDHFLEFKDPEPALTILTGYELRAGRILPLDGVEGDDTHKGGHKLPQFAAHQGTDESAFLQAVKESVAKSLQAVPGEGR